MQATQRLDGRDRGFTLVELLVVVIIVGILAAIAIPVFLNQRKRAVDASLKSDLKNAATVVETFLGDPQAPMHPHIMAPSGAGSSTFAVFRDAGLKATPGNVMWIAGVPRTGAFRICAFNPRASSATSQAQALFYDNSAGGIQPTLGDCRYQTPDVANWWFGLSYNPYP